MLQKKIVPYTRYRGYAEAGLFGLLYLLRRNKNECVVLSNFRKLAERIIQQRYDSVTDIPFLEWSDIGFVFYWDNIEQSYIILYPGGSKDLFTVGLKQCIRCKGTRFVISILTLKTKEGQYHANIVLYDIQTHTLERFDPYEAPPPGMNLDHLDNLLREAYVELDPDVNFIHTAKLSFFQGWQYSQEHEGERHIRDPIGLCQPHTILYADTRMSFPNQDPGSIPLLFANAAKSHNMSLTMFSRNYAEHLHESLETIFARFTKKQHRYENFDNVRVPVLALVLEQLALYKTVFT